MLVWKQTDFPRKISSLGIYFLVSRREVRK